MHPLHTLLNSQPVQWKTLGETLTRTKGTKITAQQMRELHKDNAPVTVYGGGKTIAQLNYGDLPAKDVQTKPSIIVKSRGIIEFEYCQRPFSHKNELWAYHAPNDQVNSKFVYYFLKQHEPYFRQIASKMQMPQIATPDTDNFKIPLPPLPLQARIVEILDQFTACNEQLTAALNKEHTLRKKQYAYYRDLLLSEAELSKVGFEWKALGKVAENLDFMRKPITGNLREAGEIPYYGASGIVDYVRDYIFDGDFLLISEDGANLLARKTPIAFSITGKSWVNNHAHVLKFSSYAERKFVEFYLNHIDLTPYISGAAQPKLNQQNLNSIKIPIPPLPHQQKIVDILDRFDTLTNSITQGLPREIELRRKQYEYYRELLLTFE